MVCVCMCVETTWKLGEVYKHSNELFLLLYALLLQLSQSEDHVYRRASRTEAALTFR